MSNATHNQTTINSHSGFANLERSYETADTILVDTHGSLQNRIPTPQHVVFHSLTQEATREVSFALVESHSGNLEELARSACPCQSTRVARPTCSTLRGDPSPPEQGPSQIATTVRHFPSLSRAATFPKNFHPPLPPAPSPAPCSSAHQSFRPHLHQPPHIASFPTERSIALFAEDPSV